MKSVDAWDGLLAYLGKPLEDFEPTADVTKPPLVLEGRLVLRCQEGGFAYDAISIEGQDIAEAIREHFETERHDAMGNTHVSWVRLTVGIMTWPPQECLEE